MLLSALLKRPPDLNTCTLCCDSPSNAGSPKPTKGAFLHAMLLSALQNSPPKPPKGVSPDRAFYVEESLLEIDFFLNIFSKKHKQGIGFKAILRPPFYTLTNGGKVY